MKAGKTYVYKSEEDRQEFISSHLANAVIDKRSDGEFYVKRIDQDCTAELTIGYYIEPSEFKYFKLKGK